MSAKRSEFGMHHVTVVPTNFDSDDTLDPDDADDEEHPRDPAA